MIARDRVLVTRHPNIILKKYFTALTLDSMSHSSAGHDLFEIRMRLNSKLPKITETPDSTLASRDKIGSGLYLSSHARMPLGRGRSLNHLLLWIHKYMLLDP